MKKYKYNNEEIAAIALLKSTGVNVLEAALIAKEALTAGRGRIKRARACIAAGDEAMKMREKTVTFARAVEAALAARQNRRARTLSDFRYITTRLMRLCKELAKKRMRSLTSAECAEYLRRAFHTPRQRNKARLILSGVFSTAQKQGWCSENPVRRIEPERIIEKRIEILKRNEIERLLTTAAVYDHGSCLAAVSMVLYAGIRPHEVERLRWEDVQVENAVICISPQHSKTGGARYVTIHPPLEKILRRIEKRAEERICPTNWRKRWTGLHRSAGFIYWQPDVLRHTFASHHLAAFRSYAELQLEMGHRSAELLRTRYIAMGTDCNLLVE